MVMRYFIFDAVRVNESPHAIVFLAIAISFRTAGACPREPRGDSFRDKLNNWSFHAKKGLNLWLFSRENNLRNKLNKWSFHAKKA